MSSLTNSQLSIKASHESQAMNPSSLLSQFTTIADIVVFQNSLQKEIVKHLRDQPFDLTVYVGRQRFQCHQLLLTSMSGYFRSALSGSWVETLTLSNSKLTEEPAMPVLTLHDGAVTAESFRLFMLMLYNDDIDFFETEITADDAVGLLSMSLYLQVETLERFCLKVLEAFIVSPASSSHSILSSQIWFLATFHGIQSLELAMMNKAAVEPQVLVSILELENIVDVSGEKLMSLIRSVINHNEKTMSSLLTAIFHWVLQNVRERKVVLNEMLDQVIFHLVSEDTLAKISEDVQLLSPCLDTVKVYLTEEKNIRASLVPNQVQHVNNETVETVSANSLSQTSSITLQKFIIVPQGLSPYSCDDLSNSSDEWFIPFFMPLTPANSGSRRPVRVLSGEELFEIDQVKTRFMSSMLEEFSTEHIQSVKPYPIGMWHTTACVWRNNMYVSGGAKCPRAFAVYRPRTSSWESLPEVPLDCERHSMAACNDRVYIIGAPLLCCHQMCRQRAWCQHLVVLVYSIKHKTWTKLTGGEKSYNTDRGSQTTDHNHPSLQENSTGEHRSSQTYSTEEEVCYEESGGSNERSSPKHSLEQQQQVCYEDLIANEQQASHNGSSVQQVDPKHLVNESRSSPNSIGKLSSPNVACQQSVGSHHKGTQHGSSKLACVEKSTDRDDLYNDSTDADESACEVISSSSCPDHSAEFVYNSSVSSVKFHYPDDMPQSAEHGHHSTKSSTAKCGQLTGIVTCKPDDTRVSISANVVNVYMAEKKKPFDIRKKRNDVKIPSMSALVGILDDATSLLLSASAAIAGNLEVPVQSDALKSELSHHTETAEVENADTQSSSWFSAEETATSPTPDMSLLTDTDLPLLQSLVDENVPGRPPRSTSQKNGPVLRIQKAFARMNVGNRPSASPPSGSEMSETFTLENVCDTDSTFSSGFVPTSSHNNSVIQCLSPYSNHEETKLPVPSILQEVTGENTASPISSYESAGSTLPPHQDRQSPPPSRFSPIFNSHKEENRRDHSPVADPSRFSPPDPSRFSPPDPSRFSPPDPSRFSPPDPSRFSPQTFTSHREENCGDSPVTDPSNCSDLQALHAAKQATPWPVVLERLDCVHPMQARTVVVGSRFILVFCPPDDETYEDYANPTSTFCVRSLVKSIDTVTGRIVKAGVVPFVPVAVPIVEEGCRCLVMAFRGDVTFWRMTADVDGLKTRSEKKLDEGYDSDNTPVFDGKQQSGSDSFSADIGLLKTEALSSATVRRQWGHLGTFLDNFVIVAKMVYHPRFMYSDLHPACLQTMFLPCRTSTSDVVESDDGYNSATNTATEF